MTMSEPNENSVQILNSWDSQGNQVADSDGVYPTVRGCGGAGYQQGYVFDHTDDKPTMVLNDQGGEQMSISYDVVSTLRSQMKHHEPIVFCDGGNERPCLVEVREAVPIENHPNDSRVKLSEDGVFQALTSRMGTGGNNTPLVMESKTVAFTQNQREEVRDLDDVATAIAAEPGMHQQTYIATCIGNGQADIASHITEEKAQTLSTMHDQLAIHVAYGVDAYNQEQYEEVSQTLREPIGGDNTAKVMTTYGLDRASYNQGQNAQFDFSVEEERAPTQTSRGPGAVAAIDFRNGSENYDVNGTMCSKETGYNNNTNQNVRVENTVRRLTPKECERLQSFPDFWTQIGEWTDSKGKVHKEADTPRYKALGNSIALPFWDWLLGRISAQYDRPATLGSLFSGIGGFDLCWELHNGKGTARWQSEIEEFPIAVCKKHFGDEDEGLEGDLDEYL